MEDAQIVTTETEKEDLVNDDTKSETDASNDKEDKTIK